MSDGTFLVSGATGKVGYHVAAQLVAEGRQVRALTRHPNTAVLPEGVEVRAGDLADVASVSEAMAGVSSVYLFPAPQGLRTAARAAAAAGVDNVVVLSSLAAGYDDLDISGEFHLGCERAVRAEGLTSTSIRPGAFMGNDLMWAPEIRSRGTVSAPYPEAAAAPVDERDIAAVAVATLTSGHPGRDVIELTGPESLTQRQRVAIIAAATGVEIDFQEISAEDARKGMLAAMPEPVVDLLLGYLAESLPVVDVTPAPPDLIGRPPLRYRDWARSNATAFTS